jgi:hypothetical protein
LATADLKRDTFGGSRLGSASQPVVADPMFEVMARGVHRFEEHFAFDFL